MRLDINVFYPELLVAVRNLRSELMSALSELTTAVAELGVKIDAYVANNTRDVEALIAEAIRQDDAYEEVDLHKLRDEVMAIVNRVPPHFEPSNL